MWNKHFWGGRKDFRCSRHFSDSLAKVKGVADLHVNCPKKGSRCSLEYDEAYLSGLRRSCRLKKTCSGLRSTRFGRLGPTFRRATTCSRSPARRSSRMDFRTATTLALERRSSSLAGSANPARISHSGRSSEIDFEYISLHPCSEKYLSPKRYNFFKIGGVKTTFLYAVFGASYQLGRDQYGDFFGKLYQEIIPDFCTGTRWRSYCCKISMKNSKTAFSSLKIKKL